MLQIDVNSNVPQESTAANENLSIAQIQELIKQEKCEAEEVSDEADLQIMNEVYNSNIEDNSERSLAKTKTLTGVKRVRFYKSPKGVKKKSKKSLTSTLGKSKEKFIANIIKDEIMDSKPDPTGSRTMHTCKFCQKDFSSAFILCLHVQIHEKVNSVSNNDDQKSSLPVNTIPPVGAVNEDETIEVSNSVCSGRNSSGCSRNIKIESVEGCVAPCPVKTESLTIIKNNFVENLKKNLSLAMNRKL